ncbi:MAG: hypothetical protein HY763_04960 [Planctomycetes bacterium]|nr:hypothetical protein [Planctomycetota bacterium]
MLNEQVRGLASRVPGIGDVPVLGALFRSVNFQRSLSELVILVTPELVAPLDAHQPVRLPTDERIDPNDFELYMLGLLEGERSAEAGAAGTESTSSMAMLPSEPTEMSIHGPWGYAGTTGTR